MSKRILLIGGNFMPEPTGIGKYNGEMIQWFARNGYDCTVISTSPYYPFWKVQEPYSSQWYRKEYIETGGKKIEVYRCPHYVPGTPTSSRRLLSEVSFSASSLLALLRLMAKKRFHYVMTVAPPFQLGYHALLYKMFRKAKFLYHIQDMQIEAARDLNMIKSKGLLSFLFRLEKAILKRTDMISSISGGMLNKISAKTGREVVFFPNWVDTGAFYPLNDKQALKEKFGLSPAGKIVLYAGAIGEKQGLEMILEAAGALQHKKDLQFVICGTGPYKTELEKQSCAMGLSNVHFLPLQSGGAFNAFLNMADVHLVVQKASAGDLVMPSKLTNILAVGGLALITAQPGSSLYQSVSDNQIGVLTEPENTAVFAERLLGCLEQDHSKTRENARRYAVDVLSIDQVLTRFAEQMEGLHLPKKGITIIKKEVKERSLQSAAS